MQGNTILLKQDNGSYQLLRISAQPGATPGLTPTAGSTIRLQTVPAAVSSRFPGGPTLALRKTIVTQQVKQKQNVNSHHHHVCLSSLCHFLVPIFFFFEFNLI